MHHLWRRPLCGLALLLLFARALRRLALELDLLGAAARMLCACFRFRGSILPSTCERRREELARIANLGAIFGPRHLGLGGRRREKRSATGRRSLSDLLGLALPFLVAWVASAQVNRRSHTSCPLVVVELAWTWNRAPKVEPVTPPELATLARKAVIRAESPKLLSNSRTS